VQGVGVPVLGVPIASRTVSSLVGSPSPPSSPGCVPSTRFSPLPCAGVMLAARRLRQCGAVAAARCLPRPRTMTVTTAPCRLHAHRRGLSAAAAAAPAPSPHPVRTPIQRIQKDILYCKTQVQQHDNDQYLCSLLLPGEARAGVHIVRAFNLELAHLLSRHSIPTVGVAPVQDVFGEAAKHNAAVRAAAQLSEEHEPTEAELNSVRVGLMKLQWWRDGLESAIEKVDSLQLHPQQAPDESTAAAAHAQPVLNMLAIAMKQYKLTPQLIARMIEARVSDRAPYSGCEVIFIRAMLTCCLPLSASRSVPSKKASPPTFPRCSRTPSRPRPACCTSHWNASACETNRPCRRPVTLDKRRASR
jgi:hypothetical protein